MWMSIGLPRKSSICRAKKNCHKKTTTYSLWKKTTLKRTSPFFMIFSWLHSSPLCCLHCFIGFIIFTCFYAYTRTEWLAKAYRAIRKEWKNEWFRFDELGGHLLSYLKSFSLFRDVKNLDVPWVTCFRFETKALPFPLQWIPSFLPTLSLLPQPFVPRHLGATFGTL